MSRPISSTAVRLPPALHDRLKAAAETHGLSMNYLLMKAVEELLDNLLDPSEVRLTRRDGSEP